MRVGSNVPATFGVLDERDDILTPDALLQQVERWLRVALSTSSCRAIS